MLAVSRVEYVIGKLAVLFYLLSMVSWIPDLLLFGLQAELEGSGWWSANLWIAGAIVTGSLLWICCAVASRARSLRLGEMENRSQRTDVRHFLRRCRIRGRLNMVLRSYWGHTINLAYMINVVLAHLFGVPQSMTVGRRMMVNPLPIETAWSVLIGLCVCCVLLLNRRLRAREVVR